MRSENASEAPSRRIRPDLVISAVRSGRQPVRSVLFSFRSCWSHSLLPLLGHLILHVVTQTSRPVVGRSGGRSNQTPAVPAAAKADRHGLAGVCSTLVKERPIERYTVLLFWAAYGSGVSPAPHLRYLCTLAILTDCTILLGKSINYIWNTGASSAFMPMICNI